MNDHVVSFIGAVALVVVVYFALRHPNPEYKDLVMSPQNTTFSPISLVPKTTAGVPVSVSKNKNTGTELHANELDYISMRVSPGSNIDSPQTELVTITLSSKSPKSVTISGWKLKSNYTNQEVTIGEGVTIYYPGIKLLNEKIVLRPGDTAYVRTSSSPIGYSFKTNACTGYLENNYNFNPSLPRTCPDPTQLANFPENPYYASCLDIIDNLGTCSSGPNTFAASVAHECRTFINENLNYGACLSNFKDSLPDFIGNKWYIYLARSQSLWKKDREKIDLLTPTGTVVSSYKN